MSENLNASFEMLKLDFPIFEVTNRRNIPIEIPLANGDSVQAQGNATVKVRSEQLIQLPSVQNFKYVSPRIEDLISYGMLGAPTPPAAPQKVEADDPPPPPPPPSENGGAKKTGGSTK